MINVYGYNLIAMGNYLGDFIPGRANVAPRLRLPDNPFSFSWSRVHLSDAHHQEAIIEITIGIKVFICTTGARYTKGVWHLDHPYDLWNLQQLVEFLSDFVEAVDLDDPGLEGVAIFYRQLTGPTRYLGKKDPQQCIAGRRERHSVVLGDAFPANDNAAPNKPGSAFFHFVIL